MGLSRVLEHEDGAQLPPHACIDQRPTPTMARDFVFSTELAARETIIPRGADGICTLRVFAVKAMVACGERLSRGQTFFVVASTRDQAMGRLCAKLDILVAEEQ